MKLPLKSSSKVLRFRAAPAGPVSDPELPGLEDDVQEGDTQTRAIPPRQNKKGPPRNVFLLGAGGMLVLLTGLLVLRPHTDPAATFEADSLNTVDPLTVAPPTPAGSLATEGTSTLSGQAPAGQITTSPGTTPSGTKPPTTTQAKNQQALQNSKGAAETAASTRSTREARGTVATDVPNIFQPTNDSGLSTPATATTSTPSYSAPQASSNTPTYRATPSAPAPQASVPTPPAAPTLTQAPSVQTVQAPTPTPRPASPVPRPQASLPPQARAFPAPSQPATIKPISVPLTTIPPRAPAPTRPAAPSVVVITPGRPPAQLPVTQQVAVPATTTVRPVTIPTGTPLTVTPGTPPPGTVTLTQTTPTVIITPNSGTTTAVTTVSSNPEITTTQIPPLQLQAIVTGTEPTATIRTPTGEQVVGIGDELPDTPYTVKAIKAGSVVLSELNTTSDLTLKLEDNQS